MVDTKIPIFDLQSSEHYIFAAGGGGSKEYGKGNGIVAILSPSANRDSNTLKIEDAFETKDPVTGIQVYKDDSRIEYKEYKKTKKSVISDGGGSSSEDSNSETLEVASSNKEENIEDSKNNKEDVKKEDNSIKKLQNMKCIYVTAITENIFYLLKFDGKFHLMHKLEKSILMSYFNSNLFLLFNNEIYGYSNPLSNPKSIKIEMKPISDVDTPTEEYLYKILSKGDKLVFENESGTQDIATNWDGFFIYKANIHKVLRENGKSVFVFKNQKYIIEGNMSQIYCYDDTLVFFSNLTKEGRLYFVGNAQKSYILPKITCFNIHKDKVLVATCKGDAVIYNKGIFQTKMHISDDPITGISLEDDTLYFSSIVGEVECTTIKRSRIATAIAMAILLLVISIIVAFFCNRWDGIKNLIN